MGAGSSVLSPQVPRSREEVAELLESASREGRRVRVVGGGTKLGFGRIGEPPDVELSTTGLDRLVEHNAGDLTAVIEAGVRLRGAQEAFAAEGQALSLDPPLGPDDAATVGGVVASGDSGPLRSRYGAARDLVVGVTAALPDGTLVRAGGKVIKNVAGYDLAKLFAGSLGTLGAIVEVAVRLHPLPPATATAVGEGGDGGEVAAAASEIAHSPLEYRCLDLRLEDGRASALVRFGGAAAREGAESAERLLRRRGLRTEVVDEDDPLWNRQREGQRSDEGVVVRTSATQTALPRVLAEAIRLGAPLVGRAGLGLCWLRLEDRSPQEAAGAVERLRAALAPAACVVVSAPRAVRELVDPFGPIDDPTLELMSRVKRRFDPAGVMAPGTFVGGI
ncbi:MAG TPA: FAD-binding oxidoreductase [Thermoleophilaceae bacterium]|jgi:glycolate oxidase FAD binding subunit|nr:FAD-binding oxidoreductase [Thermoleophilaceae bacterium]